MFQVVQIHSIATPPETYAPIVSPQGEISPIATGLVGLAVGALAGAGYIASRKFSTIRDDESVPGIQSSVELDGSHGKPDPGPTAGPAPKSSNTNTEDSGPHDGPEASA